MMTFRNHRLRDFAVPMGTNWLLNDLAEAKGKQELYTRQSPQMLKALREMALVQSVESSNRIEGVTVDRDRLRPLVLGHARPKDRSEQDIAGYRRALHLIHTEVETLSITPDLLRRLHRLSQEGSGDAGQFKKMDNEVIELQPGAAPIIRFTCVSAKATPAAVDELCLVYRHAIDQDHIPPLVAIGALVLDFLCVHPFRDGNGRVSRLLTLLALYQQGYEVGRYISLERLIEEAKEDYYHVLQQSSQRWHEASMNCSRGSTISSRSPAAPMANSSGAPVRSKPRAGQRLDWCLRPFVSNQASSASPISNRPVPAWAGNGFAPSSPS